MYYPPMAWLFAFVFIVCSLFSTNTAAQTSVSPEAVPAGLLKTYDRLDAVFTNFDFDAHCQVTSFTLVYLPKRGDVVEYTNLGPSFSSQLKRMVQQARPGDRYLFESIKVHCPHDPASRAIPGLAVTVK